MRTTTLLGGAALIALATAARAQDDLAAREAAVPETPLKTALFGELHVHTSYSLDAYIGGARLTPFDAYRFARGETVLLNGQKHNIAKPLDFAAVTDHAEYIGEMFTVQVDGAPGHDQAAVVELRDLPDFEAQEKWYLENFQANQRSGDPKAPNTAQTI
jgi:hypothetical protein